MTKCSPRYHTTHRLDSPEVCIPHMSDLVKEIRTMEATEKQLPHCGRDPGSSQQLLSIWKE
jgi:hypothetical protein